LRKDRHARVCEHQPEKESATCVRLINFIRSLIDNEFIGFCLSNQNQLRNKKKGNR